jgi:hypothetical protein
MLADRECVVKGFIRQCSTEVDFVMAGEGTGMIADERGEPPKTKLPSSGALGYGMDIAA